MRLVRVTAVSATVHIALELRFGTARVDAAREVELGIPLSALADPRRFVHDLVGQVGGSLAAQGRVGLAGRLSGTRIAEEDVEVTFNLARLLSGTAVILALRAMR